MHSDSIDGTSPRNDAEQLVLESYGRGYALLRPMERLSRLQRFARRFAAATRPDRRYILTDAGRRALRMADLFEPRESLS